MLKLPLAQLIALITVQNCGGERKKTVCFKQTRKFPVHEFVMVLLSLVMTIKKVKKRYYKIIRSSLLVSNEYLQSGLSYIFSLHQAP